MLPSELSLGANDTTAPIPGMTERRPPETPLLEGIPIAFTNFPAPLYIPHVVITVTTDYTFKSLRILSPLEGLIPSFESIAPNLAKVSTLTRIEHNLK